MNQHSNHIVPFPTLAVAPGPTPKQSLPSAASVAADMDAPAMPPRKRGGRAARNRKERGRKKRRRFENRRILAKEKANGCWLCGDPDWPAGELHFHHVDRRKKRDNVAHLVSRSTESFRAEIAQCRLICRDCHEKHHEDLNSEAWRTGNFYDL